MGIVYKLKSLINKDKNNKSEYWNELRSKLDSGEEIKVCDDYEDCYRIGTYKGYKYLHEYRGDTYDSCASRYNIYINMPKNEESTYKLYGRSTTDYCCYTLHKHSRAKVMLEKLGLLRDGYAWFDLQINASRNIRSTCNGTLMIVNIPGCPKAITLRGLYNYFNNKDLTPEIEYCKEVIDTITGRVRKKIVSNKDEHYIVYDNTIYKFEGIYDESLIECIRVILPFTEVVRDITDLEVMIGAVQLDDGTVIELN